MIYDTFENIHFYCQPGDKLFRALVFARDFDLSQPDGVYKVEGDEIFAKVQSYETSPAEQRKFESHENYFDIQVLREGCERQDVALAEKLEPLGAYDPKDDVVKLKSTDKFSSIVMEPGKFAVFYPQDVHRPNCNYQETAQVRKICMKVRI